MSDMCFDTIKPRCHLPAGKLPVVAAVIGDDQQDSQPQSGQQRTLTGNVKTGEMPSLSTGAANRAHVVRMKMAADEATLQASVPLLPQKARTKVPLLLYASQVWEGVPPPRGRSFAVADMRLMGG